jgi:DNA-binding phage protein
MNFTQMLDELKPKTKKRSITFIANEAGVSRGTVYNFINDPDKTSLGTLKRIFSALGYEIELSLKKVQCEDEN